MSEQPSKVRRVAIVVYGVLVAGLAGVTLYMSVFANHELTSPYVAAPAIGALWFALRVFMILGSRK